MSTKSILAAEHLTFGYRAEKNTLDDVSLELHAGEVLGLLGPNGTGKTTLLRCIARLLQPQHGTVGIAGEDLSSLGAGEIAKRIAYVPQYNTASFGMTALQVVLMGRLPYAGHRYSARDEEIAFGVMRRMELEPFALRNIKEMSGGERQRVFIARALAQETRASSSTSRRRASTSTISSSSCRPSRRLQSGRASPSSSPSTTSTSPRSSATAC